MADWKEILKGPAKFRDAPFFVDSSEFSGGRKNVEHEYPFADVPYHEDMGRKGRGFSVDGYVLGHDYLDARDKLLSALETSGAGELVHPYLGTRRVVVESFRLRESANEGGFAKFTIDFKETATEPTHPTASVDAKSAVKVSAAASITAAENEFLTAYKDITTRRETTADALRAASLAVNKVIERLTMEAQAIASIRDDLDNLTESATSLAGTPAVLFETLAGMFDGLAEGLLSAIDPSAEMAKVYDFNPGVRPLATTPNGEQEQLNYDAIKFAVQRLALINAARLALNQTYANYTDATRTREMLVNLIDEQAGYAADDMFPALQQLRSDIVKAIPGEDTDLPRLLSHTPRATLPSLVLAHKLYGNLDFEADLIARNKIKNACFVPGLVDLEILSND